MNTARLPNPSYPFGPVFSLTARKLKRRSPQFESAPAAVRRSAERQQCSRFPAQPLRLFTGQHCKMHFSRGCYAINYGVSWLSLNYGFISKRGRTHSPAAKAFMDNVRQIEKELPA